MDRRTSQKSSPKEVKSFIQDVNLDGKLGWRKNSASKQKRNLKTAQLKRNDRLVYLNNEEKMIGSGQG